MSNRIAQLFTTAAAMAVFLFAAAATPQAAEAQSIGDPVSVTNLVGAGSGAAIAGEESSSERRISTGFTTGGTNADYFAISDVTVHINTINGSPTALGVAIHAARTVSSPFGDGDAQYPTGPALITFPPRVVAVGQQVFTAPPGAVLQGDTTYALVVSAPGSTGNADYRVRVENDDADSGDNDGSGWSIGDARVDSRDGGATWSGTDVGGSSLAFRIRGTVSPPPLVLSAPADQNDYFAGTAITPLTLPAATGGIPPYAYTLTPDLPDGLSFNANTRVLSGTPTAFTAAADYTYGVSDSAGETATANFRIAVGTCALDLGAVNAAINRRAFATHRDCMASQTSTGNAGNRSIFVTFTSGFAGDYRFDLVAPGNNQANDAYIILRAGADNRSGQSLAFDDDSGFNVNASLTHTLDANTAYTLELTRLGGPHINPGPLQLSIAVPPLVLSAPADQTYFAGTAITPLTLPSATGGTPPYIHSLTPALDGLSFNAATRVLSGTPAAFAAAADYTYGVSDSAGATATANFRIAVDACSADIGAVHVASNGRPFTTHANCPASDEVTVSTSISNSRSIFVAFTSGFAGEYRFDLAAPANNSSNDAHLVLRAGADNRTGTYVAIDDDGGFNVNARITHTLTANTAYTLEMTRLGRSGGGVGALELSFTVPLFTECPLINTTVNGPKDIADGANCEITAHGVINNSNATGALRGSRVRRVSSFNYNFVDDATVTNRGSITSSAGWAVLLNGDDNTFTNYGSATNSGGRYAMGVAQGENRFVGATRGVVMNETGGSISTSGQNSPAVFQRGDGHRVENRGSISTSGGFLSDPVLQSHAIEQQGHNNTIINEGAGSITTSGNLAAIRQHGGNNGRITISGGNITGMHTSADGIFQSGDNGIITVGDGATVTGGRDGLRVQGDNATIHINGTLVGGSGGYGINIIGTGNTVVWLSRGKFIGGMGNMNIPAGNTLLDRRVSLPAVAAERYTAGLAIPPLTLPEATEGEAPYVYALGGLPAGLSFAPATRILSGTPLAAADATDYTYTATDSVGNTAERLFSITVDPPADVNNDGAFNADDVAILLAVLSPANLTDPATRARLLAAAVGSADDAVLQAAIANAQAWPQRVAGIGGDLTGDGTVNTADALVLYHAHTLAHLVGACTPGDGGGAGSVTGGSAHWRGALLGALAPAGANDARLQQMLCAAHTLSERMAVQ